MRARVSVFQLSHKFINKQEDVPESAQQVVYYALAVGHHVGVMDCFSTVLEIPLEEFSTWIESLPEGPGRTKLAGVLKWGEIEINRSHVDLLLPLVESNNTDTVWTPLLGRCLRAMLHEPALYYMIRKYA